MIPAYGCLATQAIRFVSCPPGSYYNASFGQALLHSIQSIHSVPFSRFLELSVIFTLMGHTRSHFPQEIHLLLSHFILVSEK